MRRIGRREPLHRGGAGSDRRLRLPTGQGRVLAGEEIALQVDPPLCQDAAGTLVTQEPGALGPDAALAMAGEPPHLRTPQLRIPGWTVQLRVLGRTANCPTVAGRQVRIRAVQDSGHTVGLLAALLTGRATGPTRTTRTTRY
ncbi:hypothetical protein [Kitasatospora griseola]|uniref:hypothetical protein n=1 Tax=Kitasatospora griseola TaxID=2064 RepID=UPI003422C867